MWPRRTTIATAAPGAIERRPLLAAAEAVDDGPLVAGCGREIGVKAQGMGYVVVDAPRQAPAARPTGLNQWGAVAMALIRRGKTATPAPSYE